MNYTPADEVNYSPDDMNNCKPTSGVVCTYCKNKNKCPNRMVQESYSELINEHSRNADTPKTKAHKLFEE